MGSAAVGRGGLLEDLEKERLRLREKVLRLDFERNMAGAYVARGARCAHGERGAEKRLMGDMWLGIRQGVYMGRQKGERERKGRQRDGGRGMCPPWRKRREKTD